MGGPRSIPFVRVAALAALLISGRAVHAQPLAESATVCGDSISRGFNAQQSLCTYTDQVPRVWATGKDHGVAVCSAGPDGTLSHAERLECSKRGPVRIFNDAASGADMRSDFYEQAARAKRNLASSLPPRYAAVFMGHNDACTDTLSKTGNSCGGDRDPDNYCRTTDAAFERELRRGLDELIQVPNARILVLATARVSELCNFEDMDGCGLTFGLPCGAVWGLPFVQLCRSLTEDCSNQRRIDMYETLVGYNEILERVTEEYARIPAAGRSATGAVKAADVALRYSVAPFQYQFRAGDVSCCDCFHPSDQAHALLAEAGWNGLQCSEETPCCAATGDPLVDARCDVQDTESFHPAGFWPDPGCASATTFTAPRLVLGGLDGPPGWQRLSFRGELALPAETSRGLDPRETGARILLASAGESVLDASLAGRFDGVQGWQRRGAAYVYRNLGADPPGGVRKLVLHDRSARAPGRVRLQLRARGLLVRSGAAEEVLRLTAVLDGATNGTCGEVELGGSASSLPCARPPSDGRLVCR